MSADPVSVRQGRIVLLLIAALFIVPFVLAVFYYHKTQQNGVWHTTNHGVLVQPAIALADFSGSDSRDEKIALGNLRGKWTLLYAPAGQCDDACKRIIFNARQVWALLSKDAWRVQRVLLLGSGSQAEALHDFLVNYPALQVWFDGQRTLLDQLPGEYFRTEPVVFLIDPLGNIMLAFPQSLDPGDMLKDLKKLLKISQIG